MVNVSAERDELIERLWAIADSSGNRRRENAQWRAIGADPNARAELSDLGVENELDTLLRTADEMDALIASGADSILRLAPLGWAPSSWMPADASGAAVNALDSGQVERADQILTDAWSAPAMLKHPALRMRALASDDDRSAIFARRSELVLLAVEDHEAGRYHASIPVVLAQIEGLVIDVSEGKQFFSEQGPFKADLIDHGSVATLPESLATVRLTFSEGLDETGTTGSLSRHGILHGRELAYDTRTNSAKSFALLQAVVEWAEPRL